MRAHAFWAAGFFLALAACSKQPQVAETSTMLPAGTASRSGQIVIPKDSPKLRQIRVEPVRTAEVPNDEVIAPGKIELNPNRVSHVTLPLTGRISSVLVRIGDRVQQGQPLLTIESSDVDASLSGYLQADAALSQAKATLLKSQADADRVRDLFEHNAVAQKEVLNADNSLAQSKAAVEQAEAVKRQAARKLEIFGLTPGKFGQKVAVHAPISGKVLEMNIVPGEYRNDQNTSVITIADLSSVWVSSDVPESSIRFIELRERLDIELAAYPGEIFTGRVARISDTVDPQTRTIKVNAEVDNSRGRFRPEMYCRIHHVDSTAQRPIVPSAAVIQSDSQNAVYLERSPGIFELAPVTLGARLKDSVAVLKGVQAGDRVVVDGAMLLKGL
ncbi:MAG TPA: efflux RND transporter periplasmic adaptor subunit [Bryobacteraceae bacterium]|nr:efflux RND transporter periplasmic adaptor subunit [Bryobacteraceae bacterium]